MIFSSAVFLFIFLPVVFLLDRLFRGTKAKNALLLASSLIFYAFGQLRYLPLLLLSVALNYGCGLLAAGKRPRLGVWLAAAGGIGMLAVFKYADFLIGTGNRLLGLSLPLTGIALPVGISFFTFQGLSYVIDVYRDRTAVSRSFVKVLLYISFFPQLIAGPIVKYHDIEKEIDERRTTTEEAALGIRRFICGLAKKLLVANTMGRMADAVFALPAGEIGMLAAWMGALCYTLQIYFDFSGYSDMAIGLGRVLGFRFLENFNYPLIARSATEFWRRWHISLGSWFRDYVYIPLGGSRKGRARQLLNILIVWLLTGLWHGAAWNFVLWGLFFAALLVLEKLFLLRVLEHLPRAAGHGYLLLAAVIGFAVFNADGLSGAAADLSCMFGFSGVPFAGAQTLYYLSSYGLLLLLAVVGATPLPGRIAARCAQCRGMTIIQPAVLLALLLVCTAYLVDGSFNPFLYFRF